MILKNRQMVFSVHSNIERKKINENLLSVCLDEIRIKWWIF